MSITISAADVNKLRLQTGAGMMDCKKAETIIIEEQVVVKKKRTYSEGDEDDDELEEDENGNVVRNDEELQLDDEYDDTFGEMPDDYEPRSPEETSGYWKAEVQPIVEPKKEEPEDEWGF